MTSRSGFRAHTSHVCTLIFLIKHIVKYPLSAHPVSSHYLSDTKGMLRNYECNRSSVVTTGDIYTTTNVRAEKTALWKQCTYTAEADCWFPTSSPPAHPHPSFHPQWSLCSGQGCNYYRDTAPRATQSWTISEWSQADVESHTLHSLSQLSPHLKSNGDKCCLFNYMWLFLIYCGSEDITHVCPLLPRPYTSNYSFMVLSQQGLFLHH